MSKTFSSNNSLSKVCSLAVLIGLPITTEHYNKRFNGKQYIPLKVWIIFVNVVKVFSLVTSAFFIRLILPSLSVRLTLYASIIGSCGIAMTIILKRKEISISLHNICKLSKKVSTSTHIGNKSINNLIFMHIMTFLVFAIFMCTFFFYQEWSNYKAASTFPFEIPDAIHSVCLAVVFLCITFSFCMGGAIFGTTLLLCDSTYIALSDIIDGYITILKRKFRRRMFSQSSLTAEIGMLNEITQQVRAADKALNDCALMLYGMVVCLLYITISIAISQESSFKTKMVVIYISWNFILVILIFRRLTMSGSRVGLESEKLRGVAVECSTIIVGDCVDEKALLTFNILLGNIKDTNLVITAGGMFVIEKGLFLTVVGTIVTYGVLLFQGN